MAKQSGLGMACYAGGYDLSGDIGSISAINGGPKPLDVTAIDKSAFERIGGIRDGGVKFMAYFNPDSGQAHPVLSALPTTDVVVSTEVGTTLGDPAALLVAKQANYDGTRAQDGAFTFEVECLANGFGLEWGRQLTAGKRTDTGAANGTSVDFGTGSTTFGAQFYLQVFSFTGTDATVKIQESSDDGVGDSWADVTGGGFAVVSSAPTAERIATASGLTVERYLRVVTTTSAGFTSLVFAVAAVRNKVSTVF